MAMMRGERDRISRLPEPIIHQIMSLLPLKDATRMTILSLQFLSFFRSLPFVDLDYSKFVGNRNRGARNGDFADHVRRSLERRVLTTDLERLSLVAAPSMNVSEVVTYALQNNVREMSIKCEFDYKNLLKQVTNPGFPYSAFKAKSIKKLSLGGFHVKQKDLTIESPLMEELTLTKSTTTGTTINISCPKLKTVKIFRLNKVEKIRIHDDTATSLESFSFTVHLNEPRLHCNDIVNLASCKSLKFLEFCHVDVEDNWFVSNVCRLTSLESLLLTFCGSLSNLVMRSERLEAVELKNCPDLVSVDLDAINLRRFDFTRVRFQVVIFGAWSVDLTKCPNVRDLTIKGDVAVPAGVWTLKFEFLERLKLSFCINLETLIVEAKQLTHMELANCPRLQGLEIKAPKLVYFAYQGNVLHMSPTWDVSSEVVVEIRLIETIPVKKESLRDFLSSFGHSKKLLLLLMTEQPLIYSLELRSKMISPLHQLRDLSIKLDSKTLPIDEMFDSLLWLVPHPEIVSICVRNAMDLKLKFYYNYCPVKDELEHQKDTTQCCKSSFFKCWRHKVMGVEIEGFSKPQERESLEKYLVCNANRAITVKHVVD